MIRSKTNRPQKNLVRKCPNEHENARKHAQKNFGHSWGYDKNLPYPFVVLHACDTAGTPQKLVFFCDFYGKFVKNRTFSALFCEFLSKFVRIYTNNSKEIKQNANQK